MHKRTVSFILVFIFFFSAVLQLVSFSRVFAVPEILHVPVQYSTIQAAVNSAHSGDTVEVASGFYNEYVFVNKSISLIGQNPLNTIIDGNGTEMNTVHVVADNVEIEGFTIQNAGGFEPSSLAIANSKNNRIFNNVIRQGYYGLRMQRCNNSYILNNIISDTISAGIYLSQSSYNSFTGNRIQNNLLGVKITDVASNSNTFYHNNFVDNINHISVGFAPTNWDNGAEGNFWSNYNGQDLNGDGIGDTLTPHLGKDRYPLVEERSETRNFSTLWKGTTYHTVVSSNSTLASFTFTYSLAQISFNATGPQSAVSYCNVTIEKSLLDGIFTVLVSSASKNYVQASNSTHSSLYFTFSHSIRKVQVRSTRVVDNTVPSANFTCSSEEPREGQQVQFTDYSTDSDGTVASWSWNFGDGYTSIQQNPAHGYSTKGTFTVTLTITDNENATNTITKTINISFALPLDYTFYYIVIAITAGAVIIGITFFLWKKKKKSSLFKPTPKLEPKLKPQSKPKPKK